MIQREARRKKQTNKQTSAVDLTCHPDVGKKKTPHNLGSKERKLVKV
jgi:hypothetical protein